MLGQNSWWGGLPTGLSMVALGLLTLGLSDTAQAQTVTLSTGGNPLTQPLTFSVPVGTVSTAQTVSVTTPPNNGNTVTVSIPAAYPWIQVNPGVISNTPGNLSVSVNATSLTTGTHSGTFSVMILGNSSSAVTVAVTATVTGSSVLSTTPTSLSFAGQVNANTGTPQGCAVQDTSTTCQITVLSSGPQLTYNITASTTDGAQWLVPYSFSGTTSGSPFDVGVNPSMVAGPGTYNGQILIQSTTTSDSVTVAVTMVVSANATLTATPSQVSFFYTAGTANPPTQQVTVASNGGLVSFTVSQSPNTPWLQVTPISSAASRNLPATLIFSVTPTTPILLSPNTYNATITINPNNGGTAPQINVSLVVSNNPILTVSTAPGNQLAFSAPFGGAAPPSQQITVGSAGASSVAFTATATSDRGWLNVTPGSGNTATAGVLQVDVVSNVLASLGVGTYTGTITIAPSNGDMYTIPIAVTLTVGAVSTVTAAPQALVFSYQLSQNAPPAQTVILSSTGPPTGFTLSTSASNSASCGTANWLSALAQQSPLTTPNVLTVSVNTSGMTPGTCNGTVRVQYTSVQGPAEEDLPVTLFVSNAPLLDISLPQGFGIESAVQGTNVNITRQITLTSTDGTTPLQYQITAQSSPCAWLFAAPSTGGTTGTTPSPAQVVINPGCITNPGPYQGSITISSGTGLPQPVMFNITLNISSTSQIAVTPQSLTFNQPQGGPAPATQNLNFTVSGGNANFIATPVTSAGGNWLTVTPASGNTSVGSIQVSASSSTLPANTYTGQITLTFPNAETPMAVIPVRLIIGAPQTLTVSPVSLGFSYVVNGTTPAAEPLTLTSAGGPVTFNIGTTSTGGWLGVDTTTGTTGTGGSKVVNVSVDPTKFPAGTTGGNQLQGSLSVSAPGVLSSPVTVNVTVMVTSMVPPAPTTIINSAIANGFGAVAPGELIAIIGTNLGPTTPAAFSVNAPGTFNHLCAIPYSGPCMAVNSFLSGVQVAFDGILGTPTYVSATQINVIVPWEIAGRTSTSMVVSYNFTVSTAIPLQVTTVAPGIYTQSATGSGQAAAVNLSSAVSTPYNGPAGGTYPGTTLATAPAPQGSFISLFLTGGGLTSPPSTDGSINPPTALPLANWTPGSSVVTATIGGVPATVQYAGAAPTLITGVVQVNLQVPTGVTGNALPVIITIDGIQSQLTATIAVQ